MKFDPDGHIGKGWLPIVRAAIVRIEQEGGSVLQVKEKFGGLRLYCHGSDVCQNIADIAEKACWMLCEECGAPGKLRPDRGWIKTLCEICNAK